MLFIYIRYKPVIAHVNLKLQAADSTERFINSFKPSGKYMYHLIYTDEVLHVSHAVRICLLYHSKTKQRLFA
jgi:hypothetical protein